MSPNFLDRPVLPPGGCGICLGDQARRAFIDRHLNLGRRAAAVERLSKEPEQPIGFAVKAETVMSHARKCLNLYMPGRGRPKHRERTKYDLAELVRERAVSNVLDEVEQVTIAHGLKAQQLIDRREERQMDRELQLGIARMLALHTQGHPIEVIEATYERLEPTEEINHEQREPDPVVRSGNHDTRNRRRLAERGVG